MHLRVKERFTHMSLRLHKRIGWGLALHADQINEERFTAFTNGGESLSYSGFIDFLRELSFPTKEFFLECYDRAGRDKHRDDDSFDYAWTRKFLQCIYGEYDDELWIDENRFILTPYGMSDKLLSPQKISPYNEDEAFVYAEFEKLFPMGEYGSNYSYSFKTAPFPDSYEIIGNPQRGDISSVKDLSFPSDKHSLGEISIIQSALWETLEDGDTQLQNLYAKIVGEGTWQLSAPCLNMALVEYSGILKDNSQIFEMKPRVVYSWS